LVLHSTTKYLGGHSDIVGGAVVGSAELITTLFVKKVHFGGCPDPHACYLLERGMRTLHARMPIHVDNSLELAKRLEKHPMISSVNHPMLEGNSQYEVAQKIMPRGTGMLAFTVDGGDDAALKFISSLEIVFEATSLGGVESLVECPFNTSHIFVPKEVKIAAGINPGFVRMSIGIEDVEDLWDDLSQALATI
jgi:cystathionine beta-lyase/cystathionine gamma-synthase